MTFLLQTTPTEKKETGLQPLFAITVEDPQKVGDPIRAFIMYTVHTKACSVPIRLLVGCSELLTRPLVRSFPILRFQSFAVTQTSCGCMRPFLLITLGWLYLLFLRRVLLDVSMTSLYSNAGPHLRTA
jgi:hypothetical protein